MAAKLKPGALGSILLGYGSLFDADVSCTLSTEKHLWMSYSEFSSKLGFSLDREMFLSHTGECSSRPCGTDWLTIQSL